MGCIGFALKNVMNILMIVPEPFLKPRGTPISVFGRARALSKLGHEIDLVTYHIGDEVSLKNVEVHRIPAVPFIREIPVGPSIRKLALDMILLVKTLLMMYRKDYDIIHSHEEGAIWGALFALMFKKKHVYDMHSSLPQQFESFQYANFSIVKTVFKWLEKFAIRRSDAVIYICPELIKVIGSIDSAKRAALIENFGAEEGFSTHEVKGIDVDAFNGRFKLLYVGTLEKYQGIDLLLKSLKYLDDLELVLLIVGGEEEQVAKYKAMARELGVDAKVEFIGKVNLDDVEAYYRIADALISARIHGMNTPLKIYKYLRSGKPVVATRIESHTQVLNDEIAVLVDVDENDIADKLKKIVTDRNILKKVQKRARIYVKENFSYERYLKLTQKLYESI